jgi:ribosomal protein S12 methylthiotransferase
MSNHAGKWKIHIISMGCAKNLVDSEKLMAQLKFGGVELTYLPEEADVAVINTCGFIEAAKRESIEMMLAQVRRKTNGKLKKVYAMGCLTERYRDELAKEIPEIDGFFGSNQLGDVLKELGAELKYELLGERVLTTPGHVAYLKVSEGCDNPCSFCAIPLMRGKHKSRPIEEIVAEAALLSAHGVKELVLIGQDTTYYGLELYGRRRIDDLVNRLAGVDGIEWIRLMYAYPAKFPGSLLDVMSAQSKVCSYLDMPVQHCSDNVLRSMRRGISQRALYQLIDTIRTKVPDIALRTTLIVGYPTETSDDFQQLLRFVAEVQFDRLGVFTYSQEDGTSAFPLGDPISQEEKEQRRNMVMELQLRISKEKNARLVGTTQKVLIDRIEGDRYVGRTERDAPEIDNEVYVRSRHELQVGDFVTVDIQDTSEYDLYGTISEAR